MMRALLALLLVCGEAQAADASLVAQVIQCESSGRKHVYGDGGVSYGIAQFRKETFYEFAALAGLKDARYHNPLHQVLLLNWGLDNGYGDRWTCYRKIMAKKAATHKSLTTPEKPKG